MLIDRGKRHAERPLLGHQHAARPVALDHRDIVVAGRTEMRRHEHVKAQIAAVPDRLELALDNQHVAPRSRA